MSLNEAEAKRLKELLISWELEDLFDLLKAEEISTKVLQIMKRQHVSELLRNQKLGIRIRFEHHFEQWRQLIRKPLEDTDNSNRFGVIWAHLISQLSKEQAKQTDLANEQTTVARSAPIQPPVSRPIITLTKRRYLDDDSLLMKQNSSIVEEAPTTTIAASKNYKKYQHVNTEKQENDSNITVLRILIESGHKGESLLQAYEEQQTFTPLQRSLLITLIAGYFEMKNYHLSLNTSHVLETQIVDLFPTERVENYRGKKKSKIYMKFNNVKRRDIDFFPSKKRTRNTNVTEAENSNSDMEPIADNCGNNKSSKVNAVETILSDNGNENTNQSNDYLIKSEHFSD